MIKAAVGQAEGIDTLTATKAAITQCRDQLKARSPQAGLVFAGSNFDHEVMLYEIDRHFPGIELIGCTTDGEISSVLGFSNDSIGLMLFSSDEIEFKAGVGPNLSNSAKTAVREALRQAGQGLGQNPSLCLAFPDGHEKDDDAILDYLTGELGPDCPVFGGCAGTLWIETHKIRQFYKTSVLNDSIPILLMTGPIEYSYSIGGGWRPIGKRVKIGDTDGQTVKTIGNMKAVDFYRHYLGDHNEPARGFVLAIYDQTGDNYYIRAPNAYLPDGAIKFSGVIPSGATVQLTEAFREDLIRHAGESVKELVQGYTNPAPAFALAFSCAFRKEILGTRNQEELLLLKRSLPPGLPMAGFYSFGELAPLSKGDLSKVNGAVLVTLLVGPGEDRRISSSINDAEEITDFGSFKTSNLHFGELSSLEALRMENEFLKKRLVRSENYRRNIEELKDFNAELHRQIIQEVEEARTEIQKKETALRESEEKYRRIVETTGSGFLLMNEQMEIIDLNEAYRDMLGYERSEILGKKPYDLATEDFKRFMKTNQHAILARDYRKIEGELRSRDGRNVPVLIHGNTLKGDRGDLIGHVAFVTDMTEHKKALQLAAEVQTSLLPQSKPNIRWLDVAGKSIPCDEIGGDYFDYLWRPDNPGGPFSAVVGDITGHGVDAALLMTTARAFLRMRASRPGSIAEILGDLNRHLSEDVEETGRFMTMFFLTLNPRNMRLNWVRAGHDPAILYNISFDTFDELKGRGIALGMDDGFAYEENYLEDLSGSHIIALGTDGIWEAQDRNGRSFGKERFKDSIRKNASRSAGAILEAVYHDLDAFTYGIPPKDDVTLVIIKLKADFCVS